MREILFRGKAANRKRGQSYRTKYKNGDWVYGLLTDPKNWAGYAEMTSTGGVSGVEVDANTVGQFTGLTDKNGKRIFEGDIVRWPGRREVGIVQYGEFNCSCCDGVFGWHFGTEDIRDHDSYEVIGNIHDNPELLSDSE